MDAAAMTGASVLLNRYGRLRWRSQATISLRPEVYPPRGAAERFAQRARDHIHAAHHAELFVCAFAVRADEADPVAVVHEGDGAIFVGQVADGRQVGVVAIHGEHRVGGDDLEARIFGSFQLRAKVLHVAIGVAETLRLAEADAVDDRCMIERVADDGVFGAKAGFEEAAVGIEARGVEDGVVGAEKVADALLELLVDVLGSADEANRGHPEAMLGERLLRRFDHSRVVGQPEIVVRAEVDDRFSAAFPSDLDRGLLRRNDDSLLLEEPFVFELGGFGGEMLKQRRMHGRRIIERGRWSNVGAVSEVRYRPLCHKQYWVFKLAYAWDCLYF